MSEQEFVPPKNKGGRPRVHVPKSRVTRDTRVPISGARDILTVQNMNPNFDYHWEVDDDETGYRIQKMRNAGYEFVQANKEEVVGQTNVYQSHNYGSIIRVPSGPGRWMYLMRIPKEWRKEDLEALEHENKMAEQSITNTQDGQYLSEFSITRK